MPVTFNSILLNQCFLQTATEDDYVSFIGTEVIDGVTVSCSVAECKGLRGIPGLNQFSYQNPYDSGHLIEPYSTTVEKVISFKLQVHASGGPGQGYATLFAANRIIAALWATTSQERYLQFQEIGPDEELQHIGVRLAPEGMPIQYSVGNMIEIDFSLVAPSPFSQYVNETTVSTSTPSEEIAGYKILELPYNTSPGIVPSYPKFILSGLIDSVSPTASLTQIYGGGTNIIQLVHNFTNEGSQTMLIDTHPPIRIENTLLGSNALEFIEPQSLFFKLGPGSGTISLRAKGNPTFTMIYAPTFI